jgi:hypothetical protein
MTFESFGFEFPFWIAPVATLALLVLFMFFSVRELKKPKTA